VIEVTAKVSDAMPLQNRVTPLSELIADPARGLVYGNRGCLHDATGAIRRRYAVRRWIACRLEFRGWQRGPMLQPGKFTELFFLDEATAFAAGHRPCALCRHDDYRRFVEFWRERHGGPVGADDIDARLHEERLDSGGKCQRPHTAELATLPDGAFVVHDGAPHLVLGPTLLRWSPSGYFHRIPRGLGPVETITPPSLVALLATGWEGAVPLIHPTAFERRSVRRNEK
jgi:hypothetical protein